MKLFISKKKIEKKYDIVYHTDMSLLIAFVTDMINQGWMPIGGVCYIKNAYHQVMIKL